MKTKYMMNGGLAFSEKKDIKKLEQLAAEGWVFEKFAWGGLYYKLIQGPKQEISYTMDFQSKPDSEYFEIFASAGWHHVSSIDNHIHVFNAPKGTPPIYSGNEVDEGKYNDMISMSSKGTIYAFLSFMVFSALLVLSKSYFDFLKLPAIILTLISLVTFIFCFLPFLSYKYQEKMNEIDEGKKKNIISNLSKEAWYSFFAIFVFFILMKISKSIFEPLHYTFFILTLISLVMALVCFLSFVWRINFKNH